MSSKRPFFVAFQSHKGGVGRTTAVANVAYQLAGQGFHVLAWDLDLRAPNLEDFDIFQDAARKSAGFMAFLERLFSNVPRDVGPGEKEYFYQCMVPVTLPAENAKGRLYLIPAFGYGGKDLLPKTSQINWKEIYLHPDDRGYHLWEGIKGILCDSMSVEGEGLSLDYVLMDVASGYGDLAKIAVIQLADMIVSMFRPNPSGIRRSGEGLRFLRQKRREAMDHPLEECLAASMVPAESMDYIQTAVKREFGQILDVIIPFEPSLLLEEKVLMDTETSIYRSYERLSNILIARNPFETSFQKTSAEIKVLSEYGQSAIAIANLAYQYHRLDFNIPRLREVLHKGAKAVESLGKTEESYILDTSDFFADDQILLFVEALAQVRRQEGLHGLIKAFTECVKKLDNPRALRNLVLKLRGPKAANPWLWAALFAAIDAHDGKVNREQGLMKASDWLCTAVESPQPPLVEPNPYRPGLSFAPEAITGEKPVFWERRELVRELLGSKNFAILGPTRTGRTWTLRMMQTLCGPKGHGDAENIRDAFFGKGEHEYLPIPETAIFLEGRRIAESMQYARSLQPVFDAFRLGLADAAEVTIERCETWAMLEKKLDDRKENLRSVALLLDDFDEFANAGKKWGDNFINNMRKFFEILPFQLVVISIGDNIYWDLKVTSPESRFMSLFTQKVLPREEDRFIQEEMPASLRNLIPRDATFEILQAVCWGDRHWQEERGKHGR